VKERKTRITANLVLQIQIAIRNKMGMTNMTSKTEAETWSERKIET